MEQLNGHKHLILGNHDKEKMMKHSNLWESVDYYKEQIKIELKKLGYYNIDWVDKEYWTKLINDLYNDEKDVEDAAEILGEYETEEQMRAQEEQELTDMFDGY